MAGLRYAKILGLRFFAFLFCVVICFAVLEAAIRFTGLMLMAPSDVRNQVRPEDASKVRILALGESTTADFFSEDLGAAWPRLLEAKLKQKGLSARVYNEGLSGTSTAMIASKLPEYLAEYRPHIVIAMMGVNDGPEILFSGYEQSWAESVISDIRILKMAAWTWDQLERVGLCKIDYSELDLENYAFAINRGVELAAAGPPLPEVEAELRRLMNTNDQKKLALMLAEIAARLSADSPPGADRSLARSYSSRAFALYPLNSKVAAVALADLDGRPEGLEVARQLLKCGKNLPDNILTQISRFASRDRELASSPVFESRKLLLQKHPHADPSGWHYRKIHRLLKREGVSLIAMQYPTLPVETLKLTFKEEQGGVDDSNDHIAFVSNQENFERLLRAMKYEAVFTDRFRGSWGHTTNIGHQAIADSVLPAVFNFVQAREDLNREVAGESAANDHEGG